MQMFEVGGCVRDEILGVASKDIDFSVVLENSDIAQESPVGELDPFAMMRKRLAWMGFEIFLEKPEHLTIRARFPKSMLIGEDLVKHRGLTADFVLARKESGYSDGRRPDSVEPGTLHDDLARRDFTMNAIAKAPDGTLIDPFNGVEDLSRRIIRAVGDPMDRFREDALRAVRALRFSVTKDMTLDDDVKRAMRHPEILALVEKVSDERIGNPTGQDKGELAKMLEFDTLKTLDALIHFPGLTEAMFSGRVSLITTLKTKGQR